MKFERVASLLILAASLAGAQASPAVATLVGTVRDSSGTPVTGAEILLRDGGKDIRSVRADARGDFLLTGVAPGTYIVWFRRLGFSSVDYSWAARDAQRDSVTVTLSAVPHGLNPVVVRAREDLMMKGTSSLLGLVVDTDGKAVEEASVDLIGGDRGGMTRANGGFLFKPLQPGPYVVRVRKLGYAPQMVTMNLQDKEDREMIVRLRPLATTLDAVQVMARSGYSPSAQGALDQLDQRLRWRSVRNIVLGPDELRRREGLPLDFANRFLGVEQMQVMRSHRGATRSINPAGSSTRKALSAESDACILINGRQFEMRPLSSYNIDDIELLEVYLSRTEDTKTVRDRMSRPCDEGPDGSHPTWYVLWLKGSKP